MAGVNLKQTQPQKNFTNEGMAGFTLIELVVVLAIMGTLLLLMYPRIDKVYTEAELSQTADVLYSNLRWCQSQSANFATTATVTIAPATRTITFVINVPPGAQVESVRQMTYPAKMAIRADTSIRFAATGRPRNATITLHKNTQEKYVVLYQTGRMRIAHEKPSS